MIQREPVFREDHAPIRQDNARVGFNGVAATLRLPDRNPRGLMPPVDFPLHIDPYVVIEADAADPTDVTHFR
jgi:hypothetical protein